MAKSDYWRGQTTVSVGENGTDFVGSLDPAAGASTRPTGRTPRDRPPSAREIARQEVLDREQTQRDVRNFVSQCAASWIEGKLTPSNPKAPQSLAAQVKKAGGNISWLAAAKDRQSFFHKSVCR